MTAKTGHATAETLWHYIDMARETEGFWVSIDDAMSGNVVSGICNQNGGKFGTTWLVLTLES